LRQVLSYGGLGGYYADPLISAGIGLFIFPRTWLLLRDVVGVLLEGTPNDVNAETVRQAIAGVKGVSDVYDLHIWSLTSGVNAMSAHAVITDHDLHDQVLSEVRNQIRSQFKLAHVAFTN
jgi:cobalt-zinc-cadmium efflux system protein